MFLDRGAHVYCRPGYGRLVLGRWLHLGVNTALRCHEGTLTVGDKGSLGRDISINCYLDVEIGDSALFADGVYVSDFDHDFADLARPIKDQGITKGRVRIGRDVWLGTKVTVCSGVAIGSGAVVGANAVVTRDLPDYAVAVGVPARVIRDRRAYVLNACGESFTIRTIHVRYSSAMSRDAEQPRPTGAAFLLAQVGAHAAARFGERVGEVGVSRPQSGILGLITAKSRDQPAGSRALAGDPAQPGRRARRRDGGGRADPAPARRERPAAQHPRPHAGRHGDAAQASRRSRRRTRTTSARHSRAGERAHN